MKFFLTNKKKKIKNQCLGLVLLCLLIIIQGCIAAAPLAYYPLATATAAGYAALTGFGIYKVVQLSTGGEFEVRFKDSELSFEQQEALSSFKRLAVYPGSQVSVNLAEALEKSGNYDIIAPYSVQKALPGATKFANTEQMTERERNRHCSKLCRALKADAIFVYSEGGTGYEHNFWSLNQSELTANFEVNLFSSKYKRIIWTQEGQAVLKQGGKFPPQDEMEQIVASAIAEKFLSAAGKKA